MVVDPTLDTALLCPPDHSVFFSGCSRDGLSGSPASEAMLPWAPCASRMIRPQSTQTTGTHTTRLISRVAMAHCTHQEFTRSNLGLKEYLIWQRSLLANLRPWFPSLGSMWSAHPYRGYPLTSTPALRHMHPGVLPRRSNFLYFAIS